MNKVTDLPDIWKEYLKENSSVAKLVLYVKINIIRGPWDFNEGESPSHRFPSQKTTKPHTPQTTFLAFIKVKVIEQSKRKKILFLYKFIVYLLPTIMGN